MTKSPLSIAKGHFLRELQNRDGVRIRAEFRIGLEILSGSGGPRAAGEVGLDWRVKWHVRRVKWHVRLNEITSRRVAYTIPESVHLTLEY